jgi:hypothetical protein
MVHPVLLYTLLALWLLPAIALIGVYCTEVLRDRVRELWARWTCYRAKQLLAAGHDAASLVDPRRTVTIGRPDEAYRHEGENKGMASANRSGRPYVVSGDVMQVPLVLEDERGELRMRQWELSLN